MRLKSTIAKLYDCIMKLVSMFEDELHTLHCDKTKTTISIKKNIADTLNKLVVIITQLNKLSKEVTGNNKSFIPKEDQKIIASYINKRDKELHE